MPDAFTWVRRSRLPVRSHVSPIEPHGSANHARWNQARREVRAAVGSSDVRAFPVFALLMVALFVPVNVKAAFSVVNCTSLNRL